MKTKSRKTLDHIRDMKIPKRINPNDLTLLKKIVSKAFLQKGNGQWYSDGGYDILLSMDNTIVGLS
jgi:hypothetical protein